MFSTPTLCGIDDNNNVGLDGARIRMETLGASAPLRELQQRLGFAVEHVVAAAWSQLKRRVSSAS